MTWKISKRTGSGDWVSDSPPTYEGTKDAVDKYIADKNKAAKAAGGPPVEYKAEQ